MAAATAAVYLGACIVDEFVPHGSLDMPHIDHADWQVHSRRPTDDGDVRSQTRHVYMPPEAEYDGVGESFIDIFIGFYVD